MFGRFQLIFCRFRFCSAIFDRSRCFSKAFRTLADNFFGTGILKKIENFKDLQLWRERSRQLRKPPPQKLKKGGWDIHGCRFRFWLQIAMAGMSNYQPAPNNYDFELDVSNSYPAAQHF